MCMSERPRVWRPQTEPRSVWIHSTANSWRRTARTYTHNQMHTFKSLDADTHVMEEMSSWAQGDLQKSRWRDTAPLMRSTGVAWIWRCEAFCCHGAVGKGNFAGNADRIVHLPRKLCGLRATWFADEPRNFKFSWTNERGSLVKTGQVKNSCKPGRTPNI